MADLKENIDSTVEYTEHQREIAEKAKQLFIAGYHCSEAIIRVFNEEYGLDYNRRMIKMATGLGGGLGKAKCSCGAVTTGAIILSSIYGRIDMHGDDSLAFDLSKELHDRFRQQFRVTCCSALTRKADWGHPNHVSICSEYVYGAALILADMMDRCQQGLGGFGNSAKKAKSRA